MAESARGAKAPRTRGGGRAATTSSSPAVVVPLQRHVLPPTSGPTFVDLFCGVGGFSLGCMQAGLVPLAAFDNDAEAVRQHEMNLGAHSAHAHELDLTPESAAADVLRLAGNRNPDVIVGGPPCQGFSFLGKRDPADVRSGLTFSFVRIVQQLQPKAFAMENVPGIFSMGTVADDLKRAVVEAGYRNATWLRLQASEFGVPQRRERALLIGSLDGRTISKGDILTAPTSLTVGEALRGVPPPKRRAAIQRNAYVAYEKPAKLGSYDAEMRSPSGLVSGCQGTVHQASVITRLKKLAYNEIDEATDYRKLDPKGLSSALRAGTRSRTACRPIHPRAARVITVREAARLHTFPDWFDFSVVVSLAHVQIGNSVPPRLAQGIGAFLRTVATKNGAVGLDAAII
jgi:DNA (cytosine-5)-methyltransferase 1